MNWVVRKRAVLEPVSVFLLIMAYIWELRFLYPVFCCFGILGLLVLSHRLHREQASTLGFQYRNFRKCVEDFAPGVILLALLLLGFGMLLQTTRHMRFDQGVLAWAAYVPWGMFQQYVLNGYFLNRMKRVVSARMAPVISAAAFSGVHIPNLFLMAVTLLAGFACARIYRRYPNLYFLGIAHGTLGFLLYLVVPDSISHHLVVGPGWFHHG
jgi:hypothetical protein